MKPSEKKPEIVYRIIDRVTGNPVGSYSRAFCDEYDFGSPDSARSANVHGVFEDKRRFAIAKYRVTYQLLNPDVDGAGSDEPDDEPLRSRLTEAERLLREAYANQPATPRHVVEFLMQGTPSND